MTHTTNRKRRARWQAEQDALLPGLVAMQRLMVTYEGDMVRLQGAARDLAGVWPRAADVVHVGRTGRAG